MEKIPEIIRMDGLVSISIQQSSFGPSCLLNWAELSYELGRVVLIRDFPGPSCPGLSCLWAELSARDPCQQSNTFPVLLPFSSSQSQTW